MTAPKLLKSIRIWSDTELQSCTDCRIVKMYIFYFRLFY